ncbi:MAG: hypothetical protein M1825_000142 [Sarcosagium campestre]|nr:MAG: hypothetical protein M1825_000142 [Sarcosagium campestre]
MTTELPRASKRQRTATAALAGKQQDVESIPTDLGNIRVQFSHHDTGAALGPFVSIPVHDASVDNLNVLVNSLLGHDASESIEYKFTAIPNRSKDDTQELYRDITHHVYNSVLKNGLITTEHVSTIQFMPKAVFRVKAVSRCSASIAGHGAAILATQFSPSDSSRVVSCSGDCTSKIIDCDTGTPIHTLKGHTGFVLVASWAPDESVIATAGVDSTVRLWDPPSGKPRGAPLKGHTKWVGSLAWEPYHLQAPGNPRLASASKDSTVRIWNTVLCRIDMVLSGHRDAVTCVKWGGLGYIYTSSHDKTVKVWNAADGTLAHSLNAHNHWVNYLATSTDFVLRTGYHDSSSSSSNSSVDIPTTDEAKRAKAKRRFIEAATNGKSGATPTERLVSVSDDAAVFLWEPSGGGDNNKKTKPIARMLGHQKQVNYASFSPDGQYVASAGFDNHVKLWDATTGKFLFTLRGHVAAVYQCMFSADSKMLVSSSKDTTVKVWSVRTGKLLNDLPGHKDEVYAVDWSPDGKRICSGGKDKVLKLWCA